MNKSAIVSLILFLLAASFASASSFFKSAAEAEADFCFGYAICE
ncbi:hypothetical protein [Methylocystis parvus]|nr:hypothetical protein [Methylocystis parvus]